MLVRYSRARIGIQALLIIAVAFLFAGWATCRARWFGTALFPILKRAFGHA